MNNQQTITKEKDKIIKTLTSKLAIKDNKQSERNPC